MIDEKKKQAALSSLISTITWEPCETWVLVAKLYTATWNISDIFIFYMSSRTRQLLELVAFSLLQNSMNAHGGVHMSCHLNSVEHTLSKR